MAIVWGVPNFRIFTVVFYPKIALDLVALWGSTVLAIMNVEFFSWNDVTCHTQSILGGKNIKIFEKWTLFLIFDDLNNSNDVIWVLAYLQLINN